MRPLAASALILLASACFPPPDSAAMPSPAQIRPSLARERFQANEPVEGSVVVHSPDGTRLTSPVEIAVYAEGVSQREENAVARLTVEPQVRELPPGAAITIPFTWDQRSSTGEPVARGAYVLMVSLASESRRLNYGVAGRVGSSLRVTLTP